MTPFRVLVDCRLRPGPEEVVVRPMPPLGPEARSRSTGNGVGAAADLGRLFGDAELAILGARVYDNAMLQQQRYCEAWS